MLFACLPASAQKPVVAAVVNAASYAKPDYAWYVAAPGSITTVFGSNLANTTLAAKDFPLPKTLGGTSVTFFSAGSDPPNKPLAAPLFFVSPGQINLQVPSGVLPYGGMGGGTIGLVVTTSAGSSDQFAMPINVTAMGIFTLDSSGCGPGAVLNVAQDGSVTVNGRENSVSPGGIVSIYGTGLGQDRDRWPDGEPAPLDRLLRMFVGARVQVPTTSSASTWLAALFSGRAPGMVGVDQVNARLPEDLVEGCSVPLRLASSLSTSQPVTIGVRRGGGRCVDPPPESLGLIRWQRTVTSGIQPPPPSDTLSVEFSAGLVKDFPQPLQLGLDCPINCWTGGSTDRLGPSCPGVGDWPLSAGRLTAQGPGFGPLEFVPQGTREQLAYVLRLPEGTIKQGTFRVASAGGPAVGPFETSIDIPAPIRVLSSFPPGAKIPSQSFTCRWEGGDPEGVVRVRLISREPSMGIEDFLEGKARTSAGQVSMWPLSSDRLPIVTWSEVEVVVTYSSEGAQVKSFQADGLTKGGRHTWSYEFRFGGLRFGSQ